MRRARSLRTKKIARPTRTKPVSPPITPPATAPAFDFLEPELEASLVAVEVPLVAPFVVVDSEIEVSVLEAVWVVLGVGGADDSGRANNNTKRDQHMM